MSAITLKQGMQAAARLLARAGQQSEDWQLPEESAAWDIASLGTTVQRNAAQAGAAYSETAAVVPQPQIPLDDMLGSMLQHAPENAVLALDGESVGRLVAATVNREIGRAARARRYTG